MTARIHFGSHPFHDEIHNESPSRYRVRIKERKESYYKRIEAADAYVLKKEVKDLLASTDNYCSVIILVRVVRLEIVIKDESVIIEKMTTPQSDNFG